VFKELIEQFAAQKWSGIAASFAKGVEEAKGPVREALNELAQWGSFVAGNAVKEWPAVLLTGEMCAVPHRGESCDGRAMVRCVGCGRGSCLAHCAIDYEAHGLCAVCISQFVSQNHGKTYRPGPRPSDRPNQTRHPEHDAVAAAFKTLGLKQTASWDEVVAKQRELAVKHHPDKAKTEIQRAKRLQRMKQVNAAVSTLREHFDRRAA